MNLSSVIKSKALEIGFSKIGIAKANFYKSDKLNLNNWIDKGYHGSMQWIERRKEERANIKEYYPNSKSVISIAMNYFTGNSSDYFPNNKISNYALNVLTETLYYVLEIAEEISLDILLTLESSNKNHSSKSRFGRI